ncbi:MAG: hypothetical protein H6672_16150 [Anaerolineaceae bacterium]|nr:hypothetical protein [Anaerolineaceae bacterium]
MRRIIILWSLLVLVLAACGNNNSGQPQSSTTSTDPIAWDRSPSTVVFRADVEGGDYAQSFTARSEIPSCTIYGDNRVIWTNDLGAFTIQTLWDRVTDDQIRTFVWQLTLDEDYFKYESRANQEPPSATVPVVETLVIRINGVERKTDSFSGWDYDYYEELANLCKNISGSPVIYEPEAAWVSAQAVPYDISAPVILWDGDAAGLKLSELAASGERRWITGGVLPFLWQSLHTSPPSLQFDENGIYYNIALEIPNVTRNSPPAPTN